MKPKDTVGRPQSTLNRRHFHLRYKYRKVRDGRKQPIRGLWERNGKFVARIATEDKDGVKCHRERFPGNFMFQLEPKEVADLRLQIGTASPEPDAEMRRRIGTASRRNVRFSPYAFTPEGIAMLSGVLRSPRAVAVNVEIMRAFVRLRRMLVSVDKLAREVEALERKAIAHDTDIQAVFQALRELMTPPAKSRRESSPGGSDRQRWAE